MTRDFTFTLATANVWYNIWSLIKSDASFTDLYFGNSPYVPNMVCEFKFQNQTPGANIYRSDSKLEGGFDLTGGSWDRDASNLNSIDLNNQNFKTDTAGAVLYVKITAR